MGPLRNFELKQHKFTTSYVKMQEAYFSESNHVGNWAIIGYTAPGSGTATSGSTTNFDYAQGGTYDERNTIATNPSGTEVWTATAKANLNDCGAGDTWGVQVTVSDDSKVSFATGMSDESNCLTLTPTFKNIGTGTYNSGS